MTKLSKEDLIVVADGQHFVLISKNKSAMEHHLEVIRSVDYDSQKYAPKNKGDSGKNFDRMGIARSPHSGPPASDKSDIRYLKDASKEIDIEYKRGGFARITLIGDSEVIGLIKQGMSKSMLSKVMREIYKNHVKTPIEKLEVMLEK
jgi:protein required for attachment to host cells